MGSKAITIELGNSALMVQNGDTLPSLVQGSLSEEVNRQVQPLKKKAEDLMLSVDSVVTVIRAIFNKNTRENLSQSFESIKNTLANLEHTTYNLDTLVGTQRNRLANIFSNIESISGNLRANNEKITNLIRNFSALSDTLGQSNISNTLLNANKAVNDFALVMEKINRGDGTLGLLVNDNKLYNQIDGAARQLQELVDDIKRNPNRYVTISVFGRNPNKYPYQPNK
jgi:phospholipid/cholesterol/gamma-HCH transport system substrate-binding protein